MHYNSTQYSTRIMENEGGWEGYISTRFEANFLQSWNWGEFHRRLGKEVFPVAFFDGNLQYGAAMVVKERAKRGTYLTVAGGPLFDWSNADHAQSIFSALRALARAHHAQFIRIRPQQVDTPELRKLIHSHGLVESPMHLTADLTLQLDLSFSEDELLAGMRKNTRYEVRRAEKLGITIEQNSDPSQIPAFYEHQVALAKKHHFVPFSLPFLQHQFDVFSADDEATLFHAFFEGKLLASAFVILSHGEAVYHYGISTPENEKLPGSYACQWAAIRWAKARGAHHYNFWGIAPQDHTHHRFAGVSLFKRGFGGEEVQYLPAHDLPVDLRYTLVRGFELVRKRLRKL